MTMKDERGTLGEPMIVARGVFRKGALLCALLWCASIAACSGKEEPPSGDGPGGSTGGSASTGDGDGDGAPSGGDGDGDFQGDGDGDGDDSSDDLDQGALAENCNGETPVEGQSCDEDGLVCHDASKRTCVCGGLTDGGDFGWNQSTEWECYSIGSLPSGSGGSDGSGGATSSGGMGGFGGADN